MSKSPFGVKTNNPGNLRAVEGVNWFGQIGAANGFCVFDTPEHGLRALCKQLVRYHTARGLKTVRDIIGRWAPPSENDTAAYVIAVANNIGRAGDAVLDMTAPATIAALCAAIVQHENGQQPYAATTIAQAARIALGLAEDPAPAPPAPPATPTPAPAAPAGRTERLDDVPAAELEQLVAEFKAAGATVAVTTQPNNLYSILATFAAE